ERAHRPFDQVPGLARHRGHAHVGDDALCKHQDQHEAECQNQLVGELEALDVLQHGYSGVWVVGRPAIWRDGQRMSASLMSAVDLTAISARLESRSMLPKMHTSWPRSS